MARYMLKIDYKISPLSINAAWQGRRFKTSTYLEYEKELLYVLPKKEQIKGLVEVNITFYFKNCLKRDIDNAIKPLLDILVKKGYIEDDRKIMKLTVLKEHRRTQGFEVVIRKYVENCD
mgnify:CR=1 FL=1